MPLNWGVSLISFRSSVSWEVNAARWSMAEVWRDDTMLEDLQRNFSSTWAKRPARKEPTSHSIHCASALSGQSKFYKCIHWTDCHHLRKFKHARLRWAIPRANVWPWQWEIFKLQTKQCQLDKINHIRLGTAHHMHGNKRDRTQKTTARSIDELFFSRKEKAAWSAILPGFFSFAPLCIRFLPSAVVRVQQSNTQY